MATTARPKAAAVPTTVSASVMSQPRLTAVPQPINTRTMVPNISAKYFFITFLAPYKAAVLPLSKKLGEGAAKVRTLLAKEFMVDYDESGSIGKRYRRQDEIGTPFCITYDFDSETDGCVTVRDRDSMEQVRVPIEGLRDFLRERVAF